MDSKKVLAVGLLCGVASWAGKASGSILPNGSFEDGGATFFQSSAQFDVNSNPAAPGWEYQITNGFLGVADDQPPFSIGSYFFYLLGVGEVYTAEASRAASSQGTLYELTFKTRNDSSDNGMTASIEFFDGNGDLLGDGGSTQTFLAGQYGTEADLRIEGLAPVGTASVGIRFDSGNTNEGSPQGGIFDNFVLAVVPSPGFGGAFALGMLGLARRRSR